MLRDERSTRTLDTHLADGRRGAIVAITRLEWQRGSKQQRAVWEDTGPRGRQQSHQTCQEAREDRPLIRQWPMKRPTRSWSGGMISSWLAFSISTALSSLGDSLLSAAYLRRGLEDGHSRPSDQ